MEPQDRSSGWIGTVLKNRWRIEARIARGGVATVFRATSRDGLVGAVKIMHPQYARNPDVRARFLREGYAANKVGHPDVVRILEDGTADEGSPFLVMELLEDGEPLEDRRERLGGRLPLDEVARAVDQLLGILSAAHAQGIVHRDIKPENLFALADGTLKVLDFGIAQIKEAALQYEPTATGLLLGTPEFMSPEQALGKRGLVDAQSDVFSVGATMFTLLSGEAVHVYDSLPLLLVAVATRPARSLASVAFKGLPREVIALVDRALVLEKHRRWASAAEMQAALRAALPWCAAKARLVPSPPPRARPRSAEVAPPAEPVRAPRGLGGTGERPALSSPKPASGRSWAPTPAEGARAIGPVTPADGTRAIGPVTPSEGTRALPPAGGGRAPRPAPSVPPATRPTGELGPRAPRVAPPAPRLAAPASAAPPATRPTGELGPRAPRPAPSAPPPATRPTGELGPRAPRPAPSVPPPATRPTGELGPRRPPPAPPVTRPTGELRAPASLPPVTRPTGEVRTVIRPVARYDTLVEEHGVPTARDGDAWSRPFDSQDMEGPTVALAAPPPGAAPPLAHAEALEEERTTLDIAPADRPPAALHAAGLARSVAPAPPPWSPGDETNAEGPPAMRAPVFHVVAAAPTPVDERLATARFALVGIAFVVVLCALAGGWLLLR